MEKQAEEPIPMVITDGRTKSKYKRGKFLGKGGFAKCYEMESMSSGKVYAGKILPKNILTKPQQKDKLKMEIKIHTALDHENVVKFISVFEDDHFVYIVLELCKSKSMLELHKRRKIVSEPETRYFVHQILQGIVYLHQKRVVHRDLKLGNLFLNDSLTVKIGDFGLATEVKAGERKQTICGTPNYIAPEVLMKKGHDFAVDIWAVGCIVYTLLVGKPPFETQSLKETYSRIKANSYSLPTTVSPPAIKLIKKLLSPNPENRPLAIEILNDEFFKCGLMPRHLPASCLTMTPRFDRRSTIHPQNPLPNSRGPLNELKQQPTVATKSGECTTTVPLGGGGNVAPGTGTYYYNNEIQSHFAILKHYLRDIENQIGGAYKPSECLSTDIESPTLAPFFWISKWVDYSDKYGLSYQLCDGSVGVLFNDNSRIVLYNDNETVQYIEQSGVENFYTSTVFPPDLNKKITLLKYFQTYMNEHLVQTGQQTKAPEDDIYSRLPFLYKWFRYKTSIVLALNNGTVQMNFFECHSKLIFCPVMAAVTYIDPNKEFHTMKLADLVKNNIPYPLELRKLLLSARKALQLIANPPAPTAAVTAQGDKGVTAK